jgi:hypothetical protein
MEFVVDDVCWMREVPAAARSSASHIQPVAAAGRPIVAVDPHVPEPVAKVNAAVPLTVPIDPVHAPLVNVGAVDDATVLVSESDLTVALPEPSTEKPVETKHAVVHVRFEKLIP